MKHIPKYLLPRITSVADSQGTEEEKATASFVPFKKEKMKGRSRGRGRGGQGGSNARGHRGRKKGDPLKRFS